MHDLLILLVTAAVVMTLWLLLRYGARKAIVVTNEALDVEPESSRIPADVPVAGLDAVDPWANADADNFAAVAQHLTLPRIDAGIAVEAEGGRSWSLIPQAAPAPTAEEHSTEIALNAIREVCHSQDLVVHGSWNGFDPIRELRRLKAAQTDRVLAAALIERDPMMAFLLPVPDAEVAPEFADAQIAWNAHRADPVLDVIDGETVEWHTGLTTLNRPVPVRELEAVR